MKTLPDVISEARAAGDSQRSSRPSQAEERTARWILPSRRHTARAYAGSLLIVVLGLAAGLALQQVLPVYSIALMLLITVQIVAILYGLWPSLAASCLTALAYNFLFIPPLHTFTIADPEHVTTLFFFTATALITSHLTSLVSSQAFVARRRAKTNEALYLFTRKLTGAVTLDDLLWATAYQIASMLSVRVVILLPEENRLSIRAGYPPEDRLDDEDLTAANYVFQHGGSAGHGTNIVPRAKHMFLPMRTGRGQVGVVGLDGDGRVPLLDLDQRRLYDALADQAALAIERINLAHDVEEARIAAETEKLRSALLTSISHDLRTPLASILGSVSSLKGYRTTLDETAQRQLIDTIQEEAERLNRFISDLLDMTKLEAGAIEPRTEPVDISDIVGSALRRADTIVAAHSVSIELPPDLPAARLDPVLFEQVLFNLFDNAAKYAPSGTTISLRASHTASAIVLEVRDEGEGIPRADLERIFDKFYRVRGGDRQRAGSGLGLAICRGFLKAMGGTITAGNRGDRSGAVFTVTVPVTTIAMMPMDVTG